MGDAAPLLISVADLAAAILPRTGSAAASGAGTASGQPLVVVDCRCNLLKPAAGLAAWREGHIPGAWHGDLDTVLAGRAGPDTGRHPLPDPAHLRLAFGRWGIGPGVRVVAYDEGSGAFAARLWWLLRWMGHREVSLLDGGLRAWTAAGFPLEAGDASGVPPSVGTDAGTGAGAGREFRGEPGQMPVVDAASLLAAVPAGERLLVDVRGAGRFRGEEEPIDPVAGHVPGAVNFPYTELVQADGRFQPAAELRRRFAGVTAGRPAGELVFMCGSGVTACHGIFALELAGWPGAALYPGSWSEWIRDPDRPVAQG